MNIEPIRMCDYAHAGAKVPATNVFLTETGKETFCCDQHTNIALTCLRHVGQLADVHPAPPTVQAAVEAAYLKAAEVCTGRQRWVKSDSGLSFRSNDPASKEAGFCADAILALSGTDALREFGMCVLRAWGDSPYTAQEVIVDRVLKGE